MDEAIRNAGKAWTEEPFDRATRDEIAALFSAGDEDELTDRFYRRLEFGTGGLRGIMGAGTNRMNRYTVAAATRGLADYLRDTVPRACARGVVISYDSRNNSRFFAEVTAAIFAADGFRTLLFPELSPVPMLASAIRFLETAAGVMITASHNPTKYNGYKVFWDDGSQVIAPHDAGIIARVNRIAPEEVTLPDFGQLLAAGRIAWVERTVYEKYYAAVLGCRRHAGQLAGAETTLGIVYSPLHGAGNKPVREILARAGFDRVSVVAEQEAPDGNFPTVKKPNPEEREAMRLAVAQGVRERAAIVMATDPDSDRVGVAIRDAAGEFVLLDGNQTGVLLADHVLSAPGLSHDNIPAVISTVVSSDLIERIALARGARFYGTLTGFKNIGARMREIANDRPDEEFVFGCEESFGYLFRDYLRDKDAVVACLMIAEAAALAAKNGSSLWQRLLGIWRQHGVYREKLFSFEQEGQAGAARIGRIMELFRSAEAMRTMRDLGGTELLDLKLRTRRDLATGQTGEFTAYPVSDVLVLRLAAGGKIAVRPSGTEPKIKFYVSLVAPVAPSAGDAEISGVYAGLEPEIDTLFAAVAALMERA